MKINKIKKNKVCPLKLEQSRGFVLLFAIVISSIILAITIGVANILFQETKFNTNAKDSNEAFFAADSGAECALYNDKTTSNSFIENGSSNLVNCFGRSINLSGSFPIWSFVVSKIGSEAKSCAKVTVDKSFLPAVFITSKGYNNGGDTLGSCSQMQDSVERQLELNY